ncbi:SDR family oxidoreductase [Duganella violaceipulchra]|uniref:NAD(P)-dependent dehydrogenase (Short-subunit alcohol dehydrogenase family) n=1 Tax=Duganella violaceipulchra TaxID=2849652 RepID=A0AA41H4N8_9BURK|nr:SDR family oxidoreductase [Duganella violaceicalia]MBV6321483.1 SDR family oxidoreductase [Duganella violaceicalia]MCP2008260.1 NAD(P)-dependent dehydrogenase (short-subunit alcohol dehydrogenase family) [Duganella violaceicalia]
MNFKDAVVFITGANRGLGKALAQAALAAGARKVYAGARDPATVTLAGVTPVKIDVTNGADIAAAAQALPDVTILINNAGIFTGSGVSTPDAVASARAELETNLFGPMALSQAFAATLKRNGGGAIVNVLSALSWISLPTSGTYSVSKAAAWALTNGLRGELQAQNTQVLGAHMGYMDTDMTDGVDAPKAAPADVALAIVTALEAGQDEVLADDTARQVKQGFTAPRSAYLGQPRAA